MLTIRPLHSRWSLAYTGAATVVACTGAVALVLLARWRAAALSVTRSLLCLAGQQTSHQEVVLIEGRRRRTEEGKPYDSAEPNLEDLEDLTEVDARQLLGAGEVCRKHRQPQLVQSEVAALDRTPEKQEHEGGRLPGRQRVYVQTHGCQHNQNDGEYMMGQLQDYGYTLVNTIQECDVCVVNSCTVKTPSEERGLNLVAEARGAGKQVVLAGCVPSGDKSLAQKFKDVSMLHVSQLDRIVDIVEEAAKGHTVTLLERRKDLAALSLPKVRKDRLSELITINAGCLGNCTYCKTKLARGTVISYPVEEIVARAQAVAAEGVRHVELASEDMGAYGVDIGTNIAELLLRLSDALPPGVMIRTGMTNPPYILQHIDGIVEALKRPNVYAFMHLPVQSGSDNVLLAMRREYTIDEFSYVVDRLKEAIPDIYILTDIICGFPSESQEDWAQTMALVKKYEFPGIYCSRFFPRPGTPAMKMKQLKPRVIKDRYQELMDFIQTLPNKNAELASREERVWFTSTEEVRHQTVGRTKNYARVLVERNDDLLGRSAKVQIVETNLKHVIGKVVGDVI